MTKIVDCFQGRMLLFSYKITHGGSGVPPRPASEADFIAKAKKNLVADGVDPGDLGELTYSVRPA